ncbi:MAG: divalent metal cation transporter [Ferruginibacter sp.]
MLSPVLGSSIASTLFAIALIASGQSSTVTGTLAGQIVMEGYLRLRINPLMRRLITRMLAIIPAIIVIAMFGEEKVDSLLIFSQVILSLQLGFAVIPLIHFVSDKKTMGNFAIKPFVQFLAWVVASVLVYLNIRMVTGEAIDYFAESENTGMKILIILAGILFIALLVYSILFPLFGKKRTDAHINMHPESDDLKNIQIPVYRKIAVALDFSENDIKLLSAAIGQAKSEKEFILIHIVESASAKLHGLDTADYETQKDKERLDFFVKQLEEKGFKAKGVLGFKESSKEIVRIVKEENADMLVIGAHGHTGLKDFIYGATINTVRHELKIPVFIVNL